MSLITPTKKLLTTTDFTVPRSDAPAMHYSWDDLPPALKTQNNLSLLETYFHISQPSVRRFVLVLFARITGDGSTVYPVGDRLEAEYLLAHSAKLTSGDVQDKMLALVRQVSAANRGDLERLYGTTRRLR